MKPILEIQNISKKYRIRGQESPYLTLRDSIMSLGKKSLKISKDEFWALKDINFNVYPGESIGIIGRNGAGKSTLLKILSRITPPTEGKIISRGRVASLLEVGTGFHAELTGRENIFLNGSILGLRKEEINKKFDEIVDFSGVEKFLDTPLKHYSSGMQLRLAFAVAAHLEPDILVIDEVLSVGDAAFQKKSLGKMEEVTKQGRTVLFVSHNLTAIEKISKRGILIDKGALIYDGSIESTIKKYLSEANITQSILINSTNRHGNGKLRVKIIELINKNGDKSDSFQIGEDITIRIHFKYNSFITAPHFKITIYNNLYSPITHFNSIISGNYFQIRNDGFVDCKIANNCLNIGKYIINIGIADGDENRYEVVDAIERAIVFYVNHGDPFKTGKLPKLGDIILKPDWNLITSTEI